MMKTIRLLLILANAAIIAVNGAECFSQIKLPKILASQAQAGDNYHSAITGTISTIYAAGTSEE